MSQNPVCIQCSGTDFFIESGFYFCSECQTQSQDIRQEVQEDVIVQGQIVGRKTKVATPSSTKVSSFKYLKKDLTSWEVMNYILKGLVDELILLGCDKKLKIIVLQMWCAYLNKLEVAFVSSIVQKKPKVGITFKTRDAEILYGTDQKVLKRYKRPLHRKSTSMSSGSSQISSKLFARKRLRLAKAVYEKTYQQSESSDRSYVSLENLETKSPTEGKTEKLKYSKHAKKVIKSVFSSMENLAKGDSVDADLAKIQNGFINRERKSWRHTTSQQLISILRLSLLVLSSDIHLCDLFRWSQEGHCSIGNTEKLLPVGVCVTKDIKAVLTQSFYSWLYINKHSSTLGQKLGVIITDVDVLPLCKRFIKDLHLPGDILPIIENLLSLLRPKVEFSSRCNYEGRAAALIIFVLKLLFGLDGSTEEFISEAAKKINKVHYQENEEQLFVWSEWCKFSECRSALISLYHPPTRDFLYPGSSVGSLKPFIGQWSKAPKKQIVKRVQGIKTELAQAVNLSLGHLGSSGSNPLKPSVFYFSSLLQQIKKKSISDEMPSILDSYCHPLIKYCAAPFLDTERTGELAKSCGIDVVPGSRKEFLLVQEYSFDNLRPTSSTHAKLVPVSLIGDTDKLNSSGVKRSSKKKLSHKVKDRLNSSTESTSESSISSQMHHSDGTNLAFRVDLENEQNHSKKRIMFSPCDEYWLFHGDFYDSAISIPEFDEISRKYLPSSFLWLLKLLSLLAQQCTRDIYRQLMLIEKIFIVETKKKRLLNLW